MRYIPANGRIDSMVVTDTNVFILKFKVDKSGGVASGGDFNAGYAEFRRRVASGGYRAGDVRAEGILTRCTQRSGAGFRRVASGGMCCVGLFCACGLDGLCHFFKMQT